MYKSRVDLVAPDVSDEYYDYVCRYADNTYGTVARSIDDAFTMTQNAGDPRSEIRAWGVGFLPVVDRSRLEHFSRSFKVSYMNWYGSVPYIIDVVEGLPQHPTNRYETRSLEQIHFAVIHHSVGWDESDPLQTIKNIAHYHVNDPDHQWPGIGYHFVISEDGRIWQTNELTTKSYHAGSWDCEGDENLPSVGVCLGGDFREHAPTESQLFAARALVQAIVELVPGQVAIVPHKRSAGASTICPGNNIEHWLRFIAGQRDYP